MAFASAGLASALRERLSGEVFDSEPARNLYSTAACLYRIPPALVVWPRDAGDVSETLRFAADAGLPVAARGAGSGVAGQPLTCGIVLDLSRHMNRIREEGDGEVFAEPGAGLAAVNEFLAPRGERFGPDPSSGDFCTIGGMFATNASGPHAPRYGATRDHVIEVDAVLADGSPLSTRAETLGQALREIVRDGADALARERPRVKKTSSGYDLWSLLDRPKAPVDLGKFLCGSEGTLAISTGLRFRTVPIPVARGSALLAFDSYGKALAQGLRFVSSHAPSAVEFLDESLLDSLRSSAPEIARRLPADTRAVLIADLDADSADELRDRLASLAKDLPRPSGPALSVTTAEGEENVRAVWEVRRASSLYVKTLGTAGRVPARFIEDAAVAPEQLPEFLAALRALLNRHALTAPVFGHAASGHLHLNPALDLSSDSDFALLETVAVEHARLVRAHGGTLTGEHGDGRLRAPLLPEVFPRVFPLLMRVKTLFDPGGRLNPGVVVPAQGARVTDGMERARGIGALRMDGTEARGSFLAACDSLGGR